MIYVVSYLLIGMTIGLYLPIKHLQTQKKAAELPRSAWSEMTDVERSLIEASVSSNPPTWIYVIIGLVWPLQIPIFIGGEVLVFRMRRRRERAHARVHAACRCPGCNCDLLASQRADVIKDAESDIVAFACPCGSTSEWDFGLADKPLFVRTRTTEGSREAALSSQRAARQAGDPDAL